MFSIRSLLSMCLALIFSFSMMGQSQIEQLSKQLDKLSGSKLISTAFKAAEIAMDAGEPDQALKFISRAEKEAKKYGQDETMALIYQKKGELLIDKGPAQKKYSDEAYKALKRSLDNTKVRSVEEENLALLYDLLPNVTDKKLSNRISDLINKTNVKIEGYAATDANRQRNEEEKQFKKRSKSELFDDFVQLESEKEQLAQERDEINAERQQLVESVEDLEVATKRLTETMRIRQQQIRSMTRQQQQNEALIEFNKRMVDSLRFEAWRDSIALQNSQMEIAQQEQDLQMQQAQLELANTELKLKNSQRNLTLALGGLIFILAGFMFWRYRETKKYNDQLQAKNEIIKAEMLKSDKLLLNILPADVAAELKSHGKVKTQFFDSATVLFTDFVKFSKIVADMNPENLIDDLDHIFSEFDKILKKYHVEKIKTIGDAYMCVGGVPIKSPDHAKRVAKVAFEMQRFLKSYNKARSEKGLPEFKARIGLHSGPLIAGVVGTSKFVYDVWGDTVNAADRMQGAGKAGMVNVSAATYDLIKDEFKGEYRGKLEIKNMDNMEAYFIEETEEPVEAKA